MKPILFGIATLIAMPSLLQANEYAYYRDFTSYRSFEENFDVLQKEKLVALKEKLRESFRVNYVPDFEIRMTSRPTKKWLKFELTTKQKIDRVYRMYHYIEIHDRQVRCYVKFTVDVPSLRFPLRWVNPRIQRIASGLTRKAAIELFDGIQGLIQGTKSK